MEITKKIRKELIDHYVDKIENVKLSKEERNKLEDMISDKISEIVDEIFELEFEVNYRIEKLTTPVYSEQERFRDMESFIYNCQL